MVRVYGIVCTPQLPWVLALSWPCTRTEFHSVLPSILKAGRPYKPAIQIFLWCGKGKRTKALIWQQVPPKPCPSVIPWIILGENIVTESSCCVVLNWQSSTLGVGTLNVGEVWSCFSETTCTSSCLGNHRTELMDECSYYVVNLVLKWCACSWWMVFAVCLYSWCVLVLVLSICS